VELARKRTPQTAVKNKIANYNKSLGFKDFYVICEWLKRG
jgi:hypothetical protein